MDCFIGLDVGTSATKGIVVAADGSARASASAATRIIRDEPGRAEVDPEDHYRSVCSVIGELASRRPRGSRVRALAMAAASGNILLTDREGRPLHNILSWLDTRSVGKSAELLQGFDPSGHHETTGWPYSELFPLAQLGWMRRNRPEVWGKAEHIGMNTDWLLYRLCGRWGMDHSTATPFFLQDQRSLSWHMPYLELLAIREEQLSPLAPSGSRLGTISPHAARDTGLDEETVVALGCFDHPGAARGAGVLRPGDLLLSCGTSWCGFYPVLERERAVRAGLLVDPFLSPRGPWGAILALTAVAVTIERYLERHVAPGLPPVERYRRFGELAASAPAGAGGLAIDIYRDRPAVLDELDPSLRERSPAQIARALMEAPALELRRRVEELERAGIASSRLVMVGGPTQSPVWTRIVAEVMGRELTVTNGQSAGAMGGAILAALAAGAFRDEKAAFAAMGGEGARFEPDPEQAGAYEGIYRGYRERRERGR